ncbi:MAG TPA: flippase-like domain-containing protein [Acidimicrobiales bacterium]|nr:flippase-like domain-containing protein [Acidimicrobiales bacterium]
MAVDTSGGAGPRAGAAAPPPGRWRTILFAPLGDGQRRRRGSDGVKLALAVIALVCCVLAIGYSSHFDRVVGGVLYPPPRSISWLVTVVYDVGAFGITGVLILLALVARRWVIARDIGLAAVGAAVISLVLSVILGANGGRPAGTVVDGINLRFPVVQVALFMAVAAAALPYLARMVQRFIEVFVLLVSVSTVTGGHGLPVNVLGSLAIGWGATAAVHLAFSSPLGLPSVSDVEALLAGLGVGVRETSPLARQAWGVATYRATESLAVGGAGAGAGLRIAVYGRDAADAKLLAKMGRFLFYRDSGPTLTFTRLQQVEHEAYLTLLADRTGVTVPEVIAAGTSGSSRDALLVGRVPVGGSLGEASPEALTDAMLDELYRQFLTLRSARIAHGSVSGETIFVDPPTGTVGLLDFRNATSNAEENRLDRDLAGAVASMALVVGPERTAASAARCLGPDVLGGVLQHLRRAGLDPALARRLRGRSSLLDEVRTLAATAGSIEIPKLAEPRRVSWPNLILVIGTLIGGWALIGTLINVTNSFDTIVGANWAWVVLVFLLTQSAFVGSAVEDLGSVAGDLPFGRVVAIEIANSFSSLAGGTPAVFATRVRFFQQQGYDASLAVSSGAVITTASWLVKGVLFVISIPLAWSTLHLEDHPASGSGHTVWVLLAAVLAVALVLGLLFAIPRVRRLASAKVRPRIAAVWQDAKGVLSTPRKLVQLFGGAIITQLTVALALAASLRAFGDHLSLATLIIVITLASMIGGVSPVPGGMGVVEAGMILGLTAAGISESDATAAVFIQRLFSSYLPPVWGWCTLVWLRRREYV